MFHKYVNLYIDSPVRNMQDLLHFRNTKRQKEFWQKQPKIVIEQTFNFRATRGVLNIEKPYRELKNVNYVSFWDDEYETEMYAFVLDVRYINKGVTELDIIPDYVSTFCQGSIINDSLAGAVINPIRQHYDLETYRERLVEIKHKPDFPVISYKHHLNRREKNFNNFSVIIGSAVNLTKDFGDENKPKQSAADGGQYDNLVGVVNLYTFPAQKYRAFMNWIEPYPWIQQNILFNYLVPSELIDYEDMTKVKLHKHPSELDDMVRTFKNGHKSKDLPLVLLDISYDKQLEQVSLVKDRDDHLLRSEIVEYRLTDFNNNIIIAPEKLRYGQDLKFKGITTVGYHNDIKIVPQGYAHSSQNGWKDGESVNYSLQLTPFDELPTALDTGKLQLAGSAYQRELERSNTIEGRVKRLTDGGNSMKDRIMSGLAIYSSAVAGGGAISKTAGLYQDQYEYERAKLAEKKQAGISQPSVSMGTNANSPAVSNGFYGVYLETIASNGNEIINARNYFNMFGFDAQYTARNISRVWCMSIVNWVQFQGSWQIKGVGRAEMQIIRDMFEGGVRLWHVDLQGRHGLHGGLVASENRPLPEREVEMWKWEQNQ